MNLDVNGKHASLDLRGPVQCAEIFITQQLYQILLDHLCQGQNSLYFHIIGDGHQPNSRGLYTHYKDSY